MLIVIILLITCIGHSVNSSSNSKNSVNRNKEDVISREKLAQMFTSRQERVIFWHPLSFPTSNSAINKITDCSDIKIYLSISSWRRPRMCTAPDSASRSWSMGITIRQRARESWMLTDMSMSSVRMIRVSIRSVVSHGMSSHRLVVRVKILLAC